MRTLCITLPETPERTARVKSHFAERGVDATYIDGVHGRSFGLLTAHPYERDHPGSGYVVGYKHVGLCLSHYCAWVAASCLGDEFVMVTEDDCRFPDDWKPRLAAALVDTPNNADMLFIGSCNCADKPTEPVAGQVFDVRYPMCTHAYIVWKRALPMLLETQRRIYCPIDIALILHSFPMMKVYTVLPRIADQFEMTLNP